MDLTLRRWRARHLLAAWSAYWVGLAGVALAPAARAIARVSGPGEHGNVAAVFGDGVVQLTVTNPSAPAWTGAVAVGALAFWATVPPLLLWVLWLVRRPRGGPAAAEPPAHREPQLGAATAAPPPGLPGPGFEPPVMGARGSAQLASSPRPGREPTARSQEP